MAENVHSKPEVECHRALPPGWPSAYLKSERSHLGRRSTWGDNLYQMGDQDTIGKALQAFEFSRTGRAYPFSSG